MKELILLIVAKLNDLTLLRDLVMSDVSEFDLIIKEIVADYCKKSESNEKELSNYS